MSLFKRSRKPTPEPDRGSKPTPEPEPGAATGQPTFVFHETNQNGAVYETYRAADAEAAKAFLMTKQVDKRLYYIVVETPRGNWGMDIEGLYLENLLPWQLDTSAADCIGQIRSVTNFFGLASAARGTVDNYVAQVQCGRCGRLWHDGLRYQRDTLVRCPGCGAGNSVDSSGVAVTEQPDGRIAVVTDWHITVEDAPDDDRDGTPAVVEQAIAEARDALAATPPGHPHRPGRLFHLGSALEEHFFRTGEPADLDAAVTAFSEAADTTAADDPDLFVRLVAVGRTCEARFDRAGRPADLDAVVTALRKALAIASPAAPERPGLLAKVGVALRDRFTLTGRPADLDDAVTYARDSLAGGHPENPAYPGYLANLSATLRVRFEHTGRRDDLDEAIAIGRRAAAGAEPGHPDHFICRGTLGLALQERFTAAGNPADLDEAISAFAEAVAGTSPDDRSHPGHQYNLGRALLVRFDRTGRQADVDGAVGAARAALDAISPDRPEHAKFLVQLGAALAVRFERTGDLGDLDEAIAVHRRAVPATPPGHSDHALHSAGLGTVLLTRFRRTGRLDDLSEAIDAVRNAVNATPATHPDQPGYLDVLGVSLQARFERTGHLGDLDEAIDAGRRAVAGTSAEHSRYPRYLCNLACALHTRFQHTSQPVDLNDAVAAGRAAVAAAPPDHPDRPTLTFNLGSTLVERFFRTGERADLDEVVANDREALAAAPPDHPLYPNYLHRLSYALRVRYDRVGEPGDLDEALTTGRAAVAGTPPDRPDYASRQANLSIILYARFGRTGESTDLNDAVDAARAAVTATPAGHPDRVIRLLTLGYQLLARYDRTGRPADLEQALTAARDAVDVESGPPADRMRAARFWGRTAMDAGRVDSAAEGFAAAVRLLPQFAWHGLPQATREERIAEWSGLAADAAACAIRAGRAEQAVELLEAGRSVLWAQLFNLRTDLTDLAERKPDLADGFERIRTLLDAPLPTAPTAPSPLADDDQVDGPRTGQDRVAEERMRLARELDELVGRIRAVQGFEHFLQPIPFARLRAAAGRGPVAIVNTSRYGCHALLLSDTGMQVVELTELTRGKAVTQANALLGILARATGSNRGFLDRERDRHTVLDILAWLWDAVAGPVLTRLGRTGPPAPGATPPRIWWSATGRLALLPLHAAGHHPRHRTGDPIGTDTVPDRVISSYTPTLTALLRARDVPAPTERPALLAIGMPTTPGAGDLTFVPDELDRIHARYPISTRLQSPAPDHGRGRASGDGEPTVARVLEELPRHAWVHFSCHGSQHFSDPTTSAFWLTDGHLHIADLIRQDTGARQLAFLSACQTATGGLKAVDEAVHLAAAMHFLGYRDVIATLWSIYDSPAPNVADTVYATLTAAGAPGAAHALHRAVAALRARWPTDPLTWAPYVHTGP
ncbi:CHAT domain-containing protein [Actinoallomurus sp. NBC_01490]|uniref:CHAT domain-containing protein n=1 Tax=Actinoallomurus sp. NBC_01490 TaxID=2903557 RepID=UPI002E3087C1|nr:CHAT domain-containing protein [Actinoallomurus sp. NBC_01490]